MSSWGDGLGNAVSRMVPVNVVSPLRESEQVGGAERAHMHFAPRRSEGRKPVWGLYALGTGGCPELQVSSPGACCDRMVTARKSPLPTRAPGVLPPTACATFWSAG